MAETKTSATLDELEDMPPRDFSLDVDTMACILGDVLDEDRPLTTAERDLVFRMMRAAFTLGTIAQGSSDDD